MHAGCWSPPCRHRLEACTPHPTHGHMQNYAVYLHRAPRQCYTSRGVGSDVDDRHTRRRSRLRAVRSRADAEAAPRAEAGRQQTELRRRRGSRGVKESRVDAGDGGEDGEEDVELFNLQTGWSVEALKEGLGAWNVVHDGSGSLNSGATASDLDNFDHADTDGGPTSWSTSNVAAFDANDDDGWSVAPVTGAGPGEGSWGVVVDEEETDRVEDLDELNDDGLQRQKVAAERALLRTIPDHVMRELERHAAEAKVEAEKLKPANLRAVAKARRLHRQLRIISGSAAGRRLLSEMGSQTRPMMETVRSAVFDILQAQLGCGSRLPDTSRWLDLFAGTGAVGIEALSRGCREAHFVELDPRIARSVLEPNLATCNLTRAASVHVMRAEDFLKTAARLDRFGGGAFDFISVCPPYELVDYVELYDLLEVSPLVKETTMVVMEYPRRLASLVRDSVGPLVKIRDRKYGRTMVAIYGPDPGVEEH